ncbi:MAG: hypothetical protein CVU56_09565 [Deltaproteobacteria bacterium HGW-Deltaproteobacteria-14]|jgi:hypothetical protein|nr:MAG: hypothetical protein CVU56_09565 [Deltaproteobacteria bacterium HGW-Deltaproteobacteria-14]
MDDWMCKCKGLVVDVTIEDVDKSGHGDNPNVLLHLAPDEVTLDAPDAEVGEVLVFAAREAALHKLTKRRPRQGDRVSVEGVASGIRPARFRLSAIEVHRDATRSNPEDDIFGGR